jgi:hypothetical protein
MKLEVYIINILLGTVVFFILRSRLRKTITQNKPRIIFTWLGTIILTPAIYIGTVALFFVIFYKEQKNDIDIAQANVTDLPKDEKVIYSQKIDTAKLKFDISNLLKVVNKNNSLPYSLTFDHGELESWDTESWHFNNNFELEQIDYYIGGENSSSKGSYRFDDSRLICHIDSGSSGNHEISFKFCHSTLNNAKGIRYAIELELDSNDQPIDSDTSTYILFEGDFLSIEKNILQQVNDKLLQINELRDSAKIKDGKIELRQAYTRTFPNTEHTEDVYTTFVVDSLLFVKLKRD